MGHLHRGAPEEPRPGPGPQHRGKKVRGVSTGIFGIPSFSGIPDSGFFGIPESRKIGALLLLSLPALSSRAKRKGMCLEISLSIVAFEFPHSFGERFQLHVNISLLSVADCARFIELGFVLCAFPNFCCLCEAQLRAGVLDYRLFGCAFKGGHLGTKYHFILLTVTAAGRQMHNLSVIGITHSPALVMF